MRDNTSSHQGNKITYNLESSGWSSDKYNELLMAVQTKFPDESRHETALRYIREAENSCSTETTEK